jgi:hypothetical protein
MSPGPSGPAGKGFLDGFFKYLDQSNRASVAITDLLGANTVEDLEVRWQKIPPEIQVVPSVADTYANCKLALTGVRGGMTDPLAKFIQGALKDWKAAVGDLKGLNPADAEQKLSEMTATAIEVFGTATLIDLTLGALPTTTEGVVSSNATRGMLTALGVGAVIAAFSHDPVKIGLLRPYQDNLEATFRNRRPDDNALFQAYRTRELCAEKVDDARKLTDVDMVRIEADNDRVWDREIAYWGYSKEFADSLARSATRTPTFGNLIALARLGLMDRGLAMYSLWGYGMDKVTMPALLDGLEAVNKVSNYAGFRSLIEPSYIAGDIDEQDLIDYWDRILVPKDLQQWVLPRLRRSRDRTAAAAQKVATAKERELTTSQVQQAYVAGLIDRGRAQGMLQDLKYETAEVDILLGLADLQRKTPGAAKLTRLPLSDYEKAFKNKIITKQEVLERMAGTYDPRDIALESKLIDIGKE